MDKRIFIGVASFTVVIAVVLIIIFAVKNNDQAVNQPSPTNAVKLRDKLVADIASVKDIKDSWQQERVTALKKCVSEAAKAVKAGEAINSSCIKEDIYQLNNERLGAFNSQLKAVKDSYPEKCQDSFARLTESGEAAQEAAQEAFDDPYNFPKEKAAEELEATVIEQINNLASDCSEVLRAADSRIPEGS